MDGYSASDKLAIALACLASILAIVLFLVEKTPRTIMGLLVAMGGLAIYPTLHFSRRAGFRIAILVCMLGGTVAFGWYVWPKTKPNDNFGNKPTSTESPSAPMQSPPQPLSAAPTQQAKAKRGRSSAIKSKAAASSKGTGPVLPQPPSVSQECDGGNCAISVNQQGGITAGQVNLQLADDQRARMSFENIHFVRGTMNIGKVPDAADTPLQKVQPDGTVVVTLPLGFPYKPIVVEVKVKNIGELHALDVRWFGGVVLSELLDKAGEDALFDRMTKVMIATQPDLKPQEVETIVMQRDLPSVDDQNAVMSKKKFPYVVLVGTFHDKFGPRPAAEFCGHYGGDDQMFKYDNSCSRHNQ